MPQSYDQKNSANKPDRLQDENIQANEIDANILENDEFSSQQLEGLTDSSELDQQFKQENQAMKSNQDLQKSNDNADAGNDDSQGNQAIREAAENIDQQQLAENLKDRHPDHPSENPAPFISDDDGK